MPNTIRLHRVLKANPEQFYCAFLDAGTKVKWHRFAMSELRQLCLAFFLAALVAACGANSESPGSGSIEQTAPRPPDVGDIGQFHSCKAEYRRALSAREQCQIATLAARCTPADDCLVTCIASPQGLLIGGGCAHVCFNGPHLAEPRPDGFAECDSLKDSSGA